MAELPGTVTEIPLDKIEIGASGARQRGTRVDEDDDLVHSVRKLGLITPVVVRRIPGDKFELIAGQRRFRAHEILRKPTIRAGVVEGDVDEYEAKMMSVATNLAHRDVRREDYEDAIRILCDRCGGARAAAEELGVSEGTVRSYLRAAGLPAEIRQDIKDRRYSLHDAKKALDALGGDGDAVDPGLLREAATALEPLPNPAKNKFVEIKRREPRSPPSRVAEKARKRAVSFRIDLEVTGDQQARIDAYKASRGMARDEDAVSALVDLGLDAA